MEQKIYPVQTENVCYASLISSHRMVVGQSAKAAQIRSLCAADLEAIALIVPTGTDGFIEIFMSAKSFRNQIA